MKNRHRAGFSGQLASHCLNSTSCPSDRLEAQERMGVAVRNGQLEGGR